MSQLEIIKGDNDFEQGFIHDAYFYYTQFMNPTKRFKDEQEEDHKPKYETKVVISEETAKDWKPDDECEKPWKAGRFIKNIAYQIETAKFEEVFKAKPPYPEQEFQYYIRLSQPAYLGDDGKASNKFGKKVDYNQFKRPKVTAPTEEEGVVEDITLTKNVGNGSKGIAVLYFTSHGKSVFPKVSEIHITDLVEYENGGGGTSSAFGRIKRPETGSAFEGNKADSGTSDDTSEGAPDLDSAAEDDKF